MLTLSWALLAIGAGLLGTWLFTRNRVLLYLGTLYVMVGLAMLGVRQAATRYSELRRESHAAERDLATRHEAPSETDDTEPERRVTSDQ